MARFPINESEVVTLIQKMISGFQSHGAVYPTPTHGSEALEEVLQNYLDKQGAAIAAQAAAVQATTNKFDALRVMTDYMKDDLRYAEAAVDGEDTKLKMIGWGGKAARTPLTAPGQPGSLIAPRRDGTSITLMWAEPTKGGKVGAYCVERRERSTEVWNGAGTAMGTQITLANQPRGVNFEYRVIAMNKAGESEPSNIVDAVF